MNIPCVQAEDIKVYLRQLVPAAQVAPIRVPAPLHTVATATAETSGSGRARRSSNTGLMASPYGAAVLHSQIVDLDNVGPVELRVHNQSPLSFLVPSRSNSFSEGEAS